jgi:hypothetical protein
MVLLASVTLRRHPCSWPAAIRMLTTYSPAVMTSSLYKAMLVPPL